jgi:prepilin-type N-terminal cleavage/methylation domain-containing protein
MKSTPKQKIIGNGKRGFTLIESLVAISVLTVAITATFSAVQSGLSSSIEARDQVASFFLAQEAVEYVRNIRDENSLYNSENPSSPRHWLFGLSENASDACYFGKACIIDGAKSLSFPPASCPTGPGSCPNLRQDTNSASATFGMYGNDPSWVETVFNREIELVDVVSGQEISVIVRMTWSKGTFTKTFTVEESILNW